MARSRSLRSKQARSQQPDRFREGYLVNVNLRSDVLARGNGARVYVVAMYECICIYMGLLRCPFVVSTRERCCIASMIHVPFEKRDLHRTSRVHSRVLRRYSSFRWLRFRGRSSQTRDRCVAPARYTWSHNFFIRIGELYDVISVDIWIDANNRREFPLKGKLMSV